MGYWLSHADYKKQWADAYCVPYETLEDRKRVDWAWKHMPLLKAFERIMLSIVNV
jgi:hypothetical protein